MIKLSYKKEAEIRMSKKEHFARYILLIFGIFFVALGIALAKRSDLGISPVSSIANVLSIKFTFFTVGTWIIIWNCVMILAQIIILRKDFKPIQFLQFPISLLLGVFTDFCVAILSFIPTDNYITKLSFILLGVIVLAFGITLMIISDTVMNVGEAFVDVVSKKLGKPFGSVKVVFDISCVLFSIILSLIFFNFKIVGTREGTIITACFTGFVIKLFTRLLKEPTNQALKKIGNSK